MSLAWPDHIPDRRAGACMRPERPCSAEMEHRREVIVPEMRRRQEAAEMALGGIAGGLLVQFDAALWQVMPGNAWLCAACVAGFVAADDATRAARTAEWLSAWRIAGCPIVEIAQNPWHGGFVTTKHECGVGRIG
mgnify:CR=1 FL=1